MKKVENKIVRLLVFDPAAKTTNLGDVIIQSAVTRELKSIFKDPSIYTVSVHKPLMKQHVEKLCESDYVFVGGSNLIGNTVFRLRTCCLWRQWKISLCDAKEVKDGILFGVGWRQYEGSTGWYTKKLLREALSDALLHSVRDQYTLNKLKDIGIENVLNTGCPTIWPLADFDSSQFPTGKADNAIVMLTDYMKNRKLDGKLLSLVNRKYRRVYCWPQSRKDIAYLKSFKLPITILDHSIIALQQFLEQTECDYIGTRLHGGICCLHAKKRSLIIAVDNRAVELGKETSLPVVARGDISRIEKWIDGTCETKITVNSEAIRQWKSQFAHA
jgi:polysaccharide pyruvyl transferase WcaK-like protein